MALCLQQEVNLSRRACWPSRDFRDNSDTNSSNNNSKNSTVKITTNNNDKIRDCSHNSFTIALDENNEENGGADVDDDNEFSNGAKNLLLILTNECHNNEKKNNSQVLTSKIIKNFSKDYPRRKSINSNRKCVVHRNSFNKNINNNNNNRTDDATEKLLLLARCTKGTATTSCCKEANRRRQQQRSFLQDIRCRSSMFLSVALVCVLLSTQCSFVAARPNMTAGTPPLTAVTSLPPSSLPPAVAVKNIETTAVPAVDGVPTIIDAHEEGGGHPERYPVFTVDFPRVELPFIIGIWILFASIAKIGFHMTPKLHKIFPESCLLIVIGVVVGIILYYATSIQVQPLTPNTFFFYMLPPIILDAGYFMPNRLFFDNLGTILLMAVVGTIFNISTIGVSLWAVGSTGFFGVETPLLHMLLFSSLISAVDPVAVLAVFEEIHVNEVLYIVVFGESLLNDAVTVVLYHMFEMYDEMDTVQIVDYVSGGASFLVVAIGGTLIGVLWGILTGFLTRYTDHVRVIEPIFVFVMAYLSYLCAEIFHMSGILAITFCGMAMKNYVEANISHKSHTTIKYALKMIASSSETIIFMFLGVATVQNEHDFNGWFIFLTIMFCTVFRVLGVLMLVNIANRFRIQKLSNVDQFVMSYGGLRGAIAFALVMLINVNHVPTQPMMLTTTIAVIYFTVFLQGITIKPLVRILNVKRAEKRKPTMNERIHERFIDHLMAGMEDIIGKTGNYNIRDKFKRFDMKFIRPLLIRDLQGAEPKIFETYSKLTMKDAMDFMKRNQSNAGGLSNTESMSALFRNYTSFFGGRFGPQNTNPNFLQWMRLRYERIPDSPSFSNLDAATRNLDMQELDYNPSKKDLTDAKIHHLLAEELKPYRRHRRLSYSRHAVDDRDLSTQVNYKMPLNIRRMVCDRKHHKRSKRGKDNQKSTHVSFPEFQQNGSAKQFANDYLNEVLHEEHEEEEAQKKEMSPQVEDWDSGLTFTAKTSPVSPSASKKSADRASSNSSLIAQITSLPGFDTSKARIVKHYSCRQSPEREPILPTAAEAFLPWRRDRSNQNFIGAEDGDADTLPEDPKRFSRDLEGEHRVATPTATETTLPWLRNDDDDEEGGIKQKEFPPWSVNKDYLAYHSPSATFLGGLTKPKQARSVIGMFRRESSTTVDTDTPGTPVAGIGTPVVGGRAQADMRSASVCGPLPLFNEVDPLGAVRPHHAGQFPVTASHRRNNRRASMLEMSGGTSTIPEEQSCRTPLFERNERDGSLDRSNGRHDNGSSHRASVARARRAQNKRSISLGAEAALLSSSTTESEEEDEDDDGYEEGKVS